MIRRGDQRPAVAGVRPDSSLYLALSPGECQHETYARPAGQSTRTATLRSQLNRGVRRGAHAEQPLPSEDVDLDAFLQLLTPRGERALAQAAELVGGDPVAAATAMRRDFPADLTAAALTQAGL